MPTTTNPFDELAAMFLTGSDGSAKPLGPPGVANAAPDQANSNVTAVTDAREDHHNGLAPHTAARAGVELLIVGHLPVRGNLWVTPYADLRSREIGSVALLRIEGGEPSIQLIRAPQQTASMAVRGSMLSAIDELSPFVDYWILRAPNALSGESLSAAIKLADQITILTSADEPAVVAAYQIIKDAAQSCGDSIEHMPPVAVAVVGTDRATADMVVERLTRATMSFLGMDIQLAMCLQRIDAGVKSTRYIGFADQPPPQFAEVIASLERARVSPAGVQDEAEAIAGRLYAERDAAEVRQAEQLLRSARPTPPRASTGAASQPIQQPPISSVAADPLLAASRGDDELSKWISAARNRLASESPQSTAPSGSSPTAPSSAASQPSAPPRRTPIKLAPKPAMAIEAKQLPKESEPARDGKPVPLASYVNGGTLKLLPVRMPGHERIEIAVDSAGRLHLIGHEQSLRELRIVEQWTRTHRELLIMACPQHPIDSLAVPHCHVFTDRPASLADLHGADLSLHVLAPVMVNGHTGWYAAALNAV